MGNTILVYLVEDWGNLEERHAFKVYEYDLRTSEEIYGKEYMFVEVETDWGDIMYLHEDIIEEVSDKAL